MIAVLGVVFGHTNEDLQLSKRHHISQNVGAFFKLLKKTLLKYQLIENVGICNLLQVEKR